MEGIECNIYIRGIYIGVSAEIQHDTNFQLVITTSYFVHLFILLGLLV